MFGRVAEGSEPTGFPDSAGTAGKIEVDCNNVGAVPPPLSLSRLKYIRFRRATGKNPETRILLADLILQILRVKVQQRVLTLGLMCSSSACKAGRRSWSMSMEDR